MQQAAQPQLYQPAPPPTRAQVAQDLVSNHMEPDINSALNRIGRVGSTQATADAINNWKGWQRYLVRLRMEQAFYPCDGDDSDDDDDDCLTRRVSKTVV